MKKRKILVFAHVPPPHHGQSVMVQIMLDGLRADQRFEVHHVDARVSDDLEDVGSFRPQKIWRLLKCIVQAWWIRLRHGRMAFYYVPAPAKRSAILRDWVVMALCRPFFSELILQWHAYGLGEWAAAGNEWQRKLTRRALGKADLSIVLNDYNLRDAEVFMPRHIKVVPNGIADLFPDYDESLRARREARAIRLRQLGLRRDKEGLETVRFLFLGHLIESKGVFVAIEATRMANEELRRSGAAWRACLTLAGSFASEEEKVRVQEAMKKVNRSGHSRRRSRRQLLGKLKKMEEGVESGEGGMGAGGSVFRSFGDSGKAGEKAHEVTSDEWRVAGGPSSAERLRVGERPEADGPSGAMIELVGFLDSGQKKSALERADCLVFPTFYEGETQGLVLLEAMSAGLPVITTSWRGVPEVLPEGYALIVTPGSDQELAAAMIAAVGNNWNAALRQRYVEHYTISEHVELLVRKLSGVSGGVD